MATCRSTSASLLLPFVLAGLAFADARALTVDGRCCPGRLSRSGATVSFLTSEGAVLDLSRLARVKLRDIRQRFPLVSGIAAADGSVLRGGVSVSSSEALLVKSARMGDLTVPFSRVARLHVESRMPFANDARGVLFRNGDFLPADSISIDPARVRVTASIGEVDLPWERIAVINLFRPGPAADAIPRIVLDNGDVLYGRVLDAGETIKVASIAGELSIPERVVCFIDFPSRMKYLSELNLERLRAGLARNLEAEDSRDDCEAGSGVVYHRGLLTRSGADVRVALVRGAGWLWFTPEIAADSDPASGTFSVSVDGRRVWSATLDSSRPPELVRVDARGAAAVSLGYDSTPPGLIGSAGVWGDAFVTVLESDGGK